MSESAGAECDPQAISIGKPTSSYHPRTFDGKSYRWRQVGQSLDHS
jgi:hypothetical protein